MLEWLNKIFPWTTVKILKQENKQLKEKLLERQEHINKTNAYWKKRLNEMLRKNR